MALTNIFTGMATAEQVLADVEVRGEAGFYEPGIHAITDTTVYMWESEWNGNKFTNGAIEFTKGDGAVLTQPLMTKTKSNQTAPETDLSNFMGLIAIGTGRQTDFDNLPTTFNALPMVDYKDQFKKDHKAKAIKIFSNAKYSIVTSTEIQGSDNGIYTKQVLDQRFVFRDDDNAATSEIKARDSEKFGNSYEYWSDKENTSSKVSIAYSKGNYDNWDDRDNRVVKTHIEQAAEYFKAGYKLSEPQPNQESVPKKEQLRASDLFMDGLSAEEVVTRMKNLDPSNNVGIDESDGTDEAPFQ